MKRILGIGIFLCLVTSLGYSQTAKYNLQYQFVWEENLDTYIIGKTYYASIVIYNLNDSPAYNISEAFYLGALNPKNEKDVRPQYTNQLTTTINIPKIDGGGYARIRTAVVFKNFYKVDTDNIVITWPVGGNTNGGTDEIGDTVNSGLKYLKDSSKLSSILSLPLQSNDTRFVVYPNPASDYIFIDINNLHNAEVKIADLQGQTLAKYSLPAGPGKHSLEIPVQNKDFDLKDGIYFIMLQSDEYSEVKKLMIAK